MPGKCKVRSGNQKAFTIIELLIGIAVIGILAPVLGLSIVHMTNVNASASNQMLAVKQVERAVYWISRDTQMAQSIQTGGGSGFPLNLYWKSWDSTSTNVTYSIQDDEIIRSYSINGAEPTDMVVGQYIDVDEEATNCQYDDIALTFKITVTTGGYRSISETRECIVIPKPQ